MTTAITTTAFVQPAPIAAIYDRFATAQGRIGDQLNAKTFSADTTSAAIRDIDAGIGMLSRAVPETPYQDLKLASGIATDVRVGLANLLQPQNGRTVVHDPLKQLSSAYDGLEGVLEILDNN